MTDEQFRYLVKITRKRLKEETMNIQHSIKLGYHKKRIISQRESRCVPGNPVLAARHGE